MERESVEEGERREGRRKMARERVQEGGRRRERRESKSCVWRMNVLIYTYM